MFTLARFVDEQTNFFGDVLDKRPSQVSRSARDPNLLVLDDNLPLKDKVANLLHSELASQQIWAIAHIAYLVSKNIECDDLIKQIPAFFLSNSAKVELAAVKTAHALLYHDSRKYSKLFFKPIMDRIAAIPAIEYAECIELMTPAIAEGCLNTPSSNQEEVSIIPLLTKLFHGDDTKKEHAGSFIVKNLSASKYLDKQITENHFNKLFLRSTIFVNEYLSPVISQNFSESSRLGEEWLSIRLPQELLKLGSDFNLGKAKFFIDFIDRIKIPELYSTLHSAYNWASKDKEIAFAISERIDKIATSRFVDLVTKTHSLLPIIAAPPTPDLHSTISTTHTESIRVKLPQLLINHPILFDGPENTLKSVFTQLANDTDATVKCAFLDHLTDLYNSTHNPHLKETLVSLYQNMFKEKDMKVLEKLVNTSMLVNLAQNRPPQTMYLFLTILDKFKTRWRFFSKILKAIEQFPQATIYQGFKQLLMIVAEALEANPQALMPQIISFYTFCIHERFNVIKLTDLFVYLVHDFAKSHHYQLRIFYLKLSTALMDEFLPNEREYYIENVWNRIAECYYNEKVEFVFIKLIEYLLEFISRFHPFDSSKLTNDIYELLTSTAPTFQKKSSVKSPRSSVQSKQQPSISLTALLSTTYINPQIDYLISELIPYIPSNIRSMSAQSLMEKLPTIIDKNSPHVRKPISILPLPIQNKSNPNLLASSMYSHPSPQSMKTIPRPINQRNPSSPKVSSRPRPNSLMPKTRPMVKTASNTSMNTMRFPKL